MLSAEVFEKIYSKNRAGKSIESVEAEAKALTRKNYDGTDSDDHKHNRNQNSRSPSISDNIKRLASSPFHCGSASVSPVSTRRVIANTTERSVNRSGKNRAQDGTPVTANGAEHEREGLTDLVSKAYRQKYSNDNRDGGSKTVIKNRNSDDRQSCIRTKQRGKNMISHSNSTIDYYESPDSFYQRFQEPPTVSKKVGIGIESTDSLPSLDRMLETNNPQSSAGSPKPVDDITEEDLLVRERRKSIQDQFRLQDLNDEETRENKYLRNVVSQLEAEISTLKFSLANAYCDGKKINDGHQTSFGDKTLMLDYDPSNIQFEESKQVIQMLIEDLRISRQNELELRNKLKSSRLTIQSTQLRYEENMAIAMKSADDVRANLRVIEQERYEERAKSSAEIVRVNKELIKTTDECVRLKQQLEHAQNLDDNRKHGMVEEVDDKEQQAGYEMNAEVEKINVVNIGIRRNGESISCDVNSLNHAQTSSKPKKEFEKPQSNDNKSSQNQGLPKSLALPQQIPPVETFLLKTDVDITRTKPNLIPETSFVDMHTGNLRKSKMQQAYQPVRLTRGSLDTRDLLSRSSSAAQNQHPTTLSRRTLDFVPNMDDSAAANESPDTTKLVSSKTSGSNAAHRSNTSNKTTLKELMSELEASKKRLQAADKKLNGLVNKDDLLNIVRNSDNSQVSGSIDVVNGLDDIIEVSYRNFAYV